MTLTLDQITWHLGGLGERRKLPHRGPGHSPGRKRILGAFRAQNRVWWQQCDMSHLIIH